MSANDRPMGEEVGNPRLRPAAGPVEARGDGGGRSTAAFEATATAGAAERPAWILGLAGLVPFLLMTAAFAYAGRAFIAFDALVTAFTGYSATILAFLGGIRWGLGLVPGHHRTRVLTLSVLPSLFGWVLLFAPVPWVFAGFAVGFLQQGLWDQLAARHGSLPAWFGRLRLVLTVVVVVCQLAVFAVLI